MIELTSEGHGGVPLVFLHGWPDDPSLWDDLAGRFPDRRRLRVQLPAFPGSAVDEGADFPELAERLEAALEREVGNQPVVLIGHDWGAILTYLFVVRHPERVMRVVTLDVGGHLEVRARHAPVFLGYQAWLIAAEAVGRAVPSLGDAMARWMARAAHAPHPERIAARAGYPYRYAWRAVLRPAYARSIVQRFVPQHPHLFLYGTRKPFPFHSGWWVAELEGREDCRVVAVDGGHWFMNSRADLVFTEVHAFVR